MRFEMELERLVVRSNNELIVHVHRVAQKKWVIMLLQSVYEREVDCLIFLVCILSLMFYILHYNTI